MRFCLHVPCLTALLGLAGMINLGAETDNQELRNVAPAVRHVMSVVRLDGRTGRLVRTVVGAPQATSDPGIDSGVRVIVEAAARAYDLNPELVDSMIRAESNYNPYAISPKGAQGLMQLMPGTARRFGVKNVFDPKENVEGGVKYLKFLEDMFQDDRLAIAAYNAGEGAVAKYGDVPPYKETVEYVARVQKKSAEIKKTAQATEKAHASAATSEKPAEEHPPVQQYVDQEGRLYLVTR